MPSDLPNAIKHLDDQQFDRLLSAVLAEQKRRGREIPVSKRKQGSEVDPTSLTVGEVNWSKKMQQSVHPVRFSIRSKQTFPGKPRHPRFELCILFTGPRALSALLIILNSYPSALLEFCGRHYIVRLKKGLPSTVVCARAMISIQGWSKQ